MRLDSVIVADAAAQSGGKLSILGAWITRFSPRQFPWSEPITVVVRVLLDADDGDADHVVSVGFNGPLSMTMPSEFRISPDQLAVMANDRIDGEEASITFSTTHHGMQFTGPGIMHVTVSIDGEEVRRCPIAIADAPLL